jgi:ferric-dicitrate binding protein FerR (iron transport regulator)
MKAKKGEVQPGVFVPPAPRVRKSGEIIEAYGDNSKMEELGLDRHTMEWIVQQDDATINEARQRFNERQASKRNKDAVKYMKKSAEAIGVEIDSKVTDPADILELIKTSGRPGAEGIATALKQFLVKFQAGEIELPSAEDTSDESAKAKKRKKASKAKKK